MIKIKNSSLKIILSGLMICIAVGLLQAQQMNITGPAGSGQFGSFITVLTNGNYVVADPYYDEGAVTDVGAVYLYNGSTHSLISTLKGSTANDQVGLYAIIALANGNFVVRSPYWHNGTATNAGAVTWVNGSTGLNATISSSNSLVGSTANDQIGNGGITELSNGNYVVISYNWDNGTAADAGAITWGNGTTGITGVISSSNSLVGSTVNDYVGNGGITTLSNGNYIIRSFNWDNGANTDAGAVTWGNGSTGTTGIVSSSNSLVGSTANDNVGIGGIIALTNGNYVVNSYNWDNGAISNAGAVTWGNGATGITGVVSSSNSLVGSAANDQVGIGGIRALSNGNYVVSSYNWDNGATINVGAVTWGNGTSGVTGTISSSNSLVGSTANDQVGSNGILALSNGNYVVNSSNWNNGAITKVGAVTWGNGTSGVTGTISSSNSLIGSVTGDVVGNGYITALSNGNYVVVSYYWDNGTATDAGAVTWGNGSTGITGVVSSSNSLVGSTANDAVGSTGILALSNGNYVVKTNTWHNGAITDAGAVTWGNGSTGITGVVSSSNSLVGSTANDYVGGGNIVALTNGNYVVASYNWDNGAISDAGAVTWGNGTTGITGVISSSNSLVGSTTSDQVGTRVTALSNGNYVVASFNWDNGTATNAGAVTWGNGTTGITGVVSSSNSLVGSTANDLVGLGGITALSNGNYVVNIYSWDNGAITNAGAVTWGNGSTGITGAVSSNNSLVGSAANDQVGYGGVTALSNNNYVVNTPYWDNGAITNAGAISFGDGASGTTGVVTGCNSVVGNISGRGSSLSYRYNSVYDYTVVAKPYENAITIYLGSDYSLSNTFDQATVTVSGSNPVAIATASGCRIIATVTPQGASPVSGSVTAKTWIESAVPTYAGLPFVARHYEITPATNAATATGRVTLYFSQQEFDDFNNQPASTFDLPTGPSDASGIANLRVAKYSGTSGDGTGLPGTYSSGAVELNPADNDIVWNASLSRWEVSVDVTGFSGFIIQTSNNPLPLKLLSFTGQLVNTNALLTWKTDGEINTKEFMVERSLDNTTFTAIGTVAAENIAGIHQYNYTDVNIALRGIPVVYYRLKQMDIDGNFTYSPTVAINIKNSTAVRLYPNPAASQIQLTIITDRGQSVNWQITDMAGRILQQSAAKINRGNNRINIHVNHLPAGLYQLQVLGETFNTQQSFIKE